MAAKICPVLETENIVQVGDKTRLDATKSFVATGEAITKVEIKPTASDDYVDVTANRYLDWQYLTAAAVVPTVRVTVTGDVTATLAGALTVCTVAADMLWSSDAELRTHEPTVMDYLADGRATFLDKHRLAQTEILRWLDKEGYTDSNNEPFTKAALTEVEEVAAWAKFVCLRLIYAGLSNAIDDIFERKSKEYKGMESQARERAVLRIDVDGDGETDSTETVDIRSCVVVRR